MNKSGKTGQVISVVDAPKCKFKGVDFSVLLPREKSEALEVLLERYPKGCGFPVHQHKECEQFYFILTGEAEITLEEKPHVVAHGSSVYIPRCADHSISNIGEGELTYLVVEVYPEGYLPEEPTWESHIQALRNVCSEG